MERTPLSRFVLILLAAIGVLWLLDRALAIGAYFADILLLFFLAWLVAFILYPLAGWLQQRRLPWPLAVLLVYLGLFLGLALVGVPALSVVVSQLLQLGANLPDYLQQVPTWGQTLQDFLRSHGLPVDLTTIYKPEEIVAQAGNWGSILMQNALGIATSVATATFNLLLVLILSIYVMLDQGRIARSIISLVPASYQDEARFFVQSVSRTFGGFIRGQLLQALIYGVVTALVMSIAGLGYAAAAGAFGGLVMLVPFVGGLIALLPPLFIGLFQASWLTALIVVAILFIAQMVIANVLMPAILSERVGLPPLLIFVAMLVGIRVAGFWGALFGIPVMGVIYAMAAYLYKYTLRGQAARDDA